MKTDDCTKKIEELEAKIVELERDNEALRSMWKELPEILKPAMLSEDDEYLREVMSDLEKKYLGGK